MNQIYKSIKNMLGGKAINPIGNFGIKKDTRSRNTIKQESNNINFNDRVFKFSGFDKIRTGSGPSTGRDILDWSEEIDLSKNNLTRIKQLRVGEKAKYRISLDRARLDIGFIQRLR